MSACGVLVQTSSKELPLKVSKNEEEKSTESNEKQPKDKVTASKDGSEKNGNPKNKRISYTKEELLELRSAPASLRRPECLSEEFFKEGVWSIEAWHKSSTSRSASPAVDGKCVTFESGKKIELLDNTIELAPHRRSFCQGCHVQAAPEAENKEKEGPLKRLGGKGGLGNDGKGSFYEGRDRLTGRASLRRRTMEKTVLRENRSDTDMKRLSKSNYDDDVERELRNINDKKSRGRDSDKENRSDERTRKDTRGQRRTESHDSLPEWMTEGPSSQLETIELKGFNKEIEEERSAMRNETKQRTVSKPQPQRARKSSKGSSRSSTPNENKQGGTNRNEAKDKVATNVKADERKKDGSRQNTPTDRMFEENAYFDVMDYLPPHLFADDYTNETSSQSKFSQWFRSRSGSSNDGSRPSSVPLSFEVSHLQGYASHSPAVPLQQYFTPIQPAPATHQYEHPIPVSPLMELFPKRRTPTAEKPTKEVKGRMTLKDIEPDIPKPIGQKPDKPAPPEDGKINDLTAFDKLVSSMKAAGQLPEKPAPVVSGLPEHLLPKPPKRTSPSFEKLKRALSRSPSPLAAVKISPLSFVNRPVSPLVAPIAERLLSPEFFKQSLHQRAVSPGSFFSSFQDGYGAQKGVQRPNQHMDQKRAAASEPRVSSVNNSGLMTPESIRNAKQQGNARIPAAFLPTSVIKKMHTDKQDVRDRPEMFDEAVATKLNFTPALHNQFDSSRSERTRGPVQELSANSNVHTVNDNAQQQLPSQSLFEGLLNGKATNHERLENSDLLAQRLKMEGSANSSDLDSQMRMGRSAQSSIPLHKDFSPSRVNPVGPNRSVGSLFSSNRSDLEQGSKGLFEMNHDNSSGAGMRQPMTGNKPDIFPGMAQGSFGPTGNNSRPGSMDIGAKNYGNGMQSKGPVNQLPNGHQNQMLNQQNLLRGTVTQRPAPQQMQMNHLPHGRNAQQNNPRIPVPMNAPASLNNMPFNRPNIPAATAAVAAQIMQQQLIHQAARAHLHAAQMLQQQQQQNILRTQMQAAVAQAYARGQAAKAMMYNPRAVANNLQAVAQQMGLRAPQPGHGAGKPLPTPLVTQPKAGEPKEVKDSGIEDPLKLQDSPLSKWFNVDALKKTPAAPTQDPTAKGKVISVEDLERLQK